MGARIASNMSCVHCKTTETPLWRAGPAGPKTLCNACGVRWKKTGSVIPRAKRPSTTAPSSANQSNTPATTTVTAAHPARKRARTTPPTASAASPAAPPPLPPRSVAPAPHRHATRQRAPPPDLALPDPAARVAAAVLPAPRPVSVFRVADAARSKYDSVFSGLMVVNRLRDAPTIGLSPSSSSSKRDDASDASRPHTRTHAVHAAAQQQHILQQQWLQTREEAVVPPSPSPPPVERADRDAVYVTEVHAPSPSPSPPPMPRVQRMGEGGGFRLLLAAMVKDPKPTT